MPTNLGNIYQTLGQYDKTLTEYLKAQRLSPADSLILGNLVDGYIRLNRLDKAIELGNEIIGRNLDSGSLRASLCRHRILENKRQHPDRSGTQL